MVVYASGSELPGFRRFGSCGWVHIVTQIFPDRLNYDHFVHDEVEQIEQIDVFANNSNSNNNTTTTNNNYYYNNYNNYSYLYRIGMPGFQDWCILVQFLQLLHGIERGIASFENPSGSGSRTLGVCIIPWLVNFARMVVSSSFWNKSADFFLSKRVGPSGGITVPGVGPSTRCNPCSSLAEIAAIRE